MTSQPHDVTAGLTGPVTDDLVKLEVTYRQPLTRYVRLVAGRYPGAASVAATPGFGEPEPGR